MQQTIEPSEISLVGNGAAASAFDDIASVHAAYEGRVFRFLLFSVKDRDLAHELTQDTFLQAWKSRASFRGECSIATWLMRIAVNLVRNHTRTGYFKFWRKASETAVDAEEMQSHLRHPAASAEAELIARQQMKQVWATVETLSDRQRTIFLLRFVDELELSEIATATGLTLPTVKSHLYRALDNVRAGQAEAGRKGGR